MTTFRVAFVDVYVIRSGVVGLEVLTLRRATGGRCPGAWEVVHGSIETGETPRQAALRELMEETGLSPIRLYNLSRVESFYRHTADEIGFIPVFVAFVGTAPERLSSEHDRAEWLSLASAAGRLAWPRERRGLEEVQILFGNGSAGPLEDVLRVELAAPEPLPDA